MFGTEGGVMITLYTSFPDDFQMEEPLFIRVDELAVPLFCSSFERRAEEWLVGREILVEEQEQDDEEFYMEDLIGFKASVGRQRGEVIDYYDSDANPLFEIRLGDKQHLIPAQEEFIAHIDFDKRTIKFILPDGLLEL